MKTKFFCMLSLLAACCWTAHGAVIDLNGVDLTVTEPNADGYVNTSQTAATLTLDLAGSVAYAGTISGNLSLIKAGAGTLTLSNACPYTGTTHVNGGVLEAPTDAYFGSGDGGAAVTLSNDARVRLTTTCTLRKRPFGVTEGATGHLEMPADVVVTTPVSNLFFKGAVLAKSGSGTLTIYAAGEIKFNANGSAAVAGGTLRVVEGSLAVTSPDVFGNASGPANMTLELCSGITLDLDRQRTPLPQRSLLRGAKITTKQRAPEYKRFEQFAYMKDYDLNSVFTVYPGEGNAITSVISAVDGCHLAQQTGDTVFDVKEGAVLRIEAKLYNAFTKTSAIQGFVKRGAGTLVMAQPCSANGTLVVEAGTVVFTRSAYLASAMTLAVWPGATVVLDDDTILASPLEIPAGDGVVTFTVPDGAAAVYANPGTSAAPEGSRTLVKAGDGTLSWTGGDAGLTALTASGGTLALRASNLLSRAAIWVDPSDATTVTTDDSDGTLRVTELRNKGRTGGAFVRGAAYGAEGSMCAAPAYLATGINGLATLSFDGNTALATRAFTNRPDTVRSLFVFCVFSRDRAYEKTTPYGPWNGPFSFSSAVNSGIDTDYTTGFCVYEHHTDSTIRFLIRGCGSGNVDMNSANLVQNEPYLFVALQRAGGGYYGLECAADNSTSLPGNRFQHGGSFSVPPLAVDIVLLGGRLGSYGRALWTAKDNTANRMWFGRMGEFIMFDSDLAQQDQDLLLSYLRKKWLNKGDGSTTPPACLAGVTPSAPALAAAALSVKGGAMLEHAAPTQTLGALDLEDGATLAQKPGAASPLFTVLGAATLSGALTLDVDPEPTESMRLFTYETLLDSSSWTITGGNSGVLSVGSRPETSAYWLKVTSGTMVIVR